MRWFCLVLAACSYAPDRSGGDGAPLPGDPDAAVGSDTAVVPPEPVIYIGSETQFAVFDVATKQVSMRGNFIDSVTSVQLTMYELALQPDGRLLGITAPPGMIYTIDKLTGVGTKIADLDLPNEQFWGATTAPAGAFETNAVVFGGTPGGELFRIDPTNGHVTQVGSFGGGFSVSGDIVWVDGVGLVGTMNSGSCDDCLASISPTTGQATLIGAVGAGDCYATGSYAGRLFVFRGSGQGYELDPTTGAMIDTWSMSGAVWSVAAP